MSKHFVENIFPSKEKYKFNHNIDSYLRLRFPDLFLSFCQAFNVLKEPFHIYYFNALSSTTIVGCTFDVTDSKTFLKMPNLLHIEKIQTKHKTVKMEIFQKVWYESISLAYKNISNLIG